MAEEEKEDVVDEVIEDQSAAAEGEKETKKELSLEEVAQLARATQKGYTIQQQKLAAIEDNLAAIAQAMNSQSGATRGDDEYVTVSRLREVLAEQKQADNAVQEQANNYVETALAQLGANGILKGQEDEESLLKFAIKIKEPDLVKASVAWREVQEAREEGKIVKKQARQDEGARVGSSSKAGTEKDAGVNYKEIKRMDWFSF